MAITFHWRGAFDNAEVNALHAAAFAHPSAADDWQGLVQRHSLGWVTARRRRRPGGLRERGLGRRLATPGSRTSWWRGTPGIGGWAPAWWRPPAKAARAAGCEWLHVDFDEEHRPFYIEACGFTPTAAGLIALR